MNSRVLSLAALVALLAGLVAACAGAASAPAPNGGGGLFDAAGNPVRGPVAAPTGAPLQPGNGNQSTGNNAIPDQQLIVYTGSLDLEVADIAVAASQAEALIKGLGGHVAASNANDTGNGKSANVTYRIPADRWSDALSGLKGLATRVTNEQTSSEDVTAKVVDLDARLANLRSTELALQAIMAKATTITDILKVQAELTQTQGDIESMTAQRDLMANQAALATLEVGFNLPAVAQVTQASTGWDLGKEIDSALASLVRLLQGVVTLLVWLVVVVLPVVIPVLIFIWIASRLYLRWRRSHPVVVRQAAAPNQWPPSV
ncbi:MAG: DUF4349 domain-containing protein [Candidatus Limnocylindrales bacterium]